MHRIDQPLMFMEIKFKKNHFHSAVCMKRKIKLYNVIWHSVSFCSAVSLIFWCSVIISYLCSWLQKHERLLDISLALCFSFQKKSGQGRLYIIWIFIFNAPATSSLKNKSKRWQKKKENKNDEWILSHFKRPASERKSEWRKNEINFFFFFFFLDRAIEPYYYYYSAKLFSSAFLFINGSLSHCIHTTRERILLFWRLLLPVS
jgi:hypothetical protein